MPEGHPNQSKYPSISTENSIPFLLPSYRGENFIKDAKALLKKEEIKEKGLEKLLDLEMPLISVLSDMEMEGIGVDVAFFSQMSEELSNRLNELEKEIYVIADEVFNINSTQQLSDVLFKTMGLPTEGLKKTKSGYYSTAASVLEELKKFDEDGIIKALLEYRELGKLKSTYVDALPNMVNEMDGRIHTSFNQTGAITGRLASSNPNLQNIPIRSEAGVRIREAFVAEAGCRLLSADYSQIELRILAHCSDDSILIKAFTEDEDVHTRTALEVFQVLQFLLLQKLLA